jgi:hypothetical protein
MAPELFDPARKPSTHEIEFDADAHWSSKLSSYVVGAIVDGESVRCRVTEAVFRDCLDDLPSGPKDFPRAFQRHRHVFERAFRKAIQDGRFTSWPDRDAGKLRREIVLDSRDFHVLVGTRSV